MPLPIVLATAVPNKNAARKLKIAAQSTASFGESTRVETTVAMLLAESWKPFRKSKTKATRIVIRTSRTSLFIFHSGSKIQGFKVSKGNGVNSGLSYKLQKFYFESSPR